jgi:hypothetical protein
MATKIIRLTEEDVNNMVLEAAMSYINELSLTRNKKKDEKQILKEKLLKCNSTLESVFLHFYDIVQAIHDKGENVKFNSISKDGQHIEFNGGISLYHLRDGYSIYAPNSYTMKVSDNNISINFKSFGSLVTFDYDLVSEYSYWCQNGDFIITIDRSKNSINYCHGDWKSKCNLKKEMGGGLFKKKVKLLPKLNLLSIPYYQLKDDLVYGWDNFIKGLNKYYNKNKNKNEHQNQQQQIVSTTFNQIPFKEFKEAAFIVKIAKGYQALTPVDKWSKNLITDVNYKNGWGVTNNSLPYFKVTTRSGNASTIIFFNANIDENQKSDIIEIFEKYKYNFTNQDLLYRLLNTINKYSNVDWDIEANKEDNDSQNQENNNQNQEEYDDRKANDEFFQSQQTNRQPPREKQQFQYQPYDYEIPKYRKIEKGSFDMNDYNRRFKM